MAKIIRPINNPITNPGNAQPIRPMNNPVKPDYIRFNDDEPSPLPPAEKLFMAITLGAILAVILLTALLAA